MIKCNYNKKYDATLSVVIDLDALLKTRRKLHKQHNLEKFGEIPMPYILLKWDYCSN